MAKAKKKKKSMDQQMRDFKELKRLDPGSPVREVEPARNISRALKRARARKKTKK